MKNDCALLSSAAVCVCVCVCLMMQIMSGMSEEEAQLQKMMRRADIASSDA